MEPSIVANPTRPTADFVAFATFAATATPTPSTVGFPDEHPAWKQNKNRN
jgi:hypothetical protein